MRLKEHFHWLMLMTRAVASQVEGQISQNAVLENFVANLRKPIRKMTMDSTFREGFFNLFHLFVGSCKG